MGQVQLTNAVLCWIGIMQEFLPCRMRKSCFKWTRVADEQLAFSVVSVYDCFNIRKQVGTIAKKSNLPKWIKAVPYQSFHFAFCNLSHPRIDLNNHQTIKTIVYISISELAYISRIIMTGGKHSLSMVTKSYSVILCVYFFINFNWSSAFYMLLFLWWQICSWLFYFPPELH